MVSNSTSTPPNGSQNTDESIAALKQYGGYIVAAIALALAGYFGWGYWQKQTVTVDTQASDDYAEIQQLNDTIMLSDQNPDLEEQAQQALANDKALLDQQIASLVAAHGDTVYAWQALMLQARQQADANDFEAAAKTLQQALAIDLKDAGLKAMAQLRYATVLLAAGNDGEALKQVAVDMPQAFEASKQELLGDIYSKQNKRDDAIRAYENAWGILAKRHEERAILRLKMEALGLTPEQMPELPALVAQAAAPLVVDTETVEISNESVDNTDDNHTLTGEQESQEANLNNVNSLDNLDDTQADLADVNSTETN